VPVQEPVAVPEPVAEAPIEPLVLDTPNPAPQAPAVDLALLAKTPQRWPKAVTLKKAWTFPAVVKGKVVGHTQAKPGSVVQLRAVGESELMVEYMGAAHRIPVEATDLTERIAAHPQPEPTMPATAAAESTPPQQTIERDEPRNETANLSTAPEARNQNTGQTPMVRPSQGVPASVVRSVGESTAAQTALSQATLKPNATQIEAALEAAGDNRPELEKALNAPAVNRKQLEILVANAPQYDLVNLTAEHLIHNISFCQRARREMSWAQSIPDEMWFEYVLPYRVADEDLDDWRPEFYAQLLPVVKTFRDTRTAARAVHEWLYKGDNGNGRIAFKVSESRDQTPRQLLHQTKIGRCFEMNLLLVSLLRSVGIPARHAGVAWWSGMDFYHYWTEYWDTEKKQWQALQPGPNPDDDSMAKREGFAAAYGFPGYNKEGDPVARERWDLMTNITPNYARTGIVELQSSVPAGSPATFAVYAWNLSAWRLVASQQGNGSAKFELSANSSRYPYLVSASVNGNIGWELVRVTAGKTESVSVHPGTRQEMVAEYHR
jgi:hypothetical protein